MRHQPWFMNMFSEKELDKEIVTFVQFRYPLLDELTPIQNTWVSDPLIVLEWN